MAIFQVVDHPQDLSVQDVEPERAAYAAGYSEGYAAGLIFGLQLPGRLIPTGLGHPAYKNGYKEGKSDGIAVCRTGRTSGRNGQGPGNTPQP